MKILNAEQIQALDRYTIDKEPIASIDLMERATGVFVEWFIRQFPEDGLPVAIFCGIGNNGGDGLAAARLLHQHFYEVTVYRCLVSDRTSEDFACNLERLPPRDAVPVRVIAEGDELPGLPKKAVVVDALFGSGLNRPVEGYWARLLQHLNDQAHPRVAIDIPSGVFADQPTGGVSFHADHTFTFELPKLAFFFPENNHRVGRWHVGSIGLDPVFIERADTPFHYLQPSEVRQRLQRRERYAHKGTFGHALLIMGSRGSIGAAVHAPRCGCDILQISVPEAMVSVDRHLYQLSEVPDLAPYTAIGAGCGLGRHRTSVEALLDLVDQTDKPLVLDADALNILSQAKNGLQRIPRGSILTPHPKEFERLFGATDNSFEENELQRRRARELGIFIVLKRAHTAIACPDGSCYFNATGNPGMATGGSGDVLTGIITGLLAQGYPSEAAAIIGVYLHGLAGDLAAAALEHESLIAGDLVNYLGNAFIALKRKNS